MKKQTGSGNKIVSKYNEFLVDKTLMKKIQNVKPTIQNNNKQFEKKINIKNTDNKSYKYKNSVQPSLAPTRPGTTPEVLAALDVLKAQTLIQENQNQNSYIQNNDNFEDFIDQDQYINQNEKFDNGSCMCNMESPQILGKTRNNFKTTNQNKFPK